MSNEAKYGGVFYLSGGQSVANITNSLFNSNTATCDGSDIFQNSTMQLRMPNTSASVFSKQLGISHFWVNILLGGVLLVLLVAIVIFLR